MGRLASRGARGRVRIGSNERTWKAGEMRERGGMRKREGVRERGEKRETDGTGESEGMRKTDVRTSRIPTLSNADALIPRAARCSSSYLVPNRDRILRERLLVSSSARLLDERRRWGQRVLLLYLSSLVSHPYAHTPKYLLTSTHPSSPPPFSSSAPTTPVSH